jgi:hypothetical protein
VADRDDNTPAFSPRIDTRVSFSNFLQWIALVDDRLEFSRLAELLEKQHLLDSFMGRTRKDSSVLRSRSPDRAEHLRQVGNNQEKASAAFQSVLAFRKRRRTGCVKNDVVPLTVLGEILACVVDYPVSAD